MSSGHTGRGGRGNRRARRGSQRQRGPDGQNNQTRPNTAMLLVSHQERHQPIPEPREEDSDAADKSFDESFDESLDESLDEAPSDAGDAGDAGDMAAATGMEPEGVLQAGVPSGGEARHQHAPETRHDQPKQQLASGDDEATRSGAGSATHPRAEKSEKQGPVLLPQATGQRGSVPYAPGMRTTMSPLLAASAGGQSAQIGPTGQSGQSDQSGQSRHMEQHAQTGADAGQRAPATAPLRVGRVDRDRGDREPVRPEVRGDVGPLIDALHELFARDRSVASQGGTTRCGICYLHYPVAELEYREAEGYYVCLSCARAMGQTLLPMVRRQQRS